MILHIPARPSHNANRAARPTRILGTSQAETVETGKTPEEEEGERNLSGKGMGREKRNRIRYGEKHRRDTKKAKRINGNKHPQEVGGGGTL